MLKRNELEADGLLNEKIKKYQDQIINIFKDVDEAKGRKEKLSIAVLYFYFFHNLSQKQLGKLTGYSAGTISGIISQLINLGKIRKSHISGKNTYSLIEDLQELADNDVIEFHRSIIDLIRNFNRLKKKILNPKLKTKKGHKELSQFINEMIKILHNYEKTSRETIKELKTYSFFSDIWQ